jgi:predicted DCC family thiol-disulfide oxidoreductase YuxK
LENHKPMPEGSEATNPIILFDGVCNLCNASVQFIINRDLHSTFKFASLQSDIGQRLLTEFNISEGQLYSVILICDGRAFERSRAALEIARRLNGLWPMMYGFIVVPAFVRDFIYDWISKNRYRWFGMRNECMMPTPEMKMRFL